ncbi:hypothetical protein L1049_021679 [Liquidambar formosana]|uniref:Uncharacterized protein n=1 Tax=Liquidambar formosana TaxID=63359 RepID=A0AAP0WMV5_LIQFO
MPTKMATFCREKVVLVTVYVERPRRRLSSNHHHHHHHHHHLYLPVKQEVKQHKHGVAGRGSDRRADLLRYSQHLRESARPAASSTPLLPKPISSNKEQTTKKIIAVRSKPKHARVPTCLGNWKLVIPNFVRSMEGRKKNKNSGSTSKKIKALMKSFEGQKKWGFFSKMFATLRKHR